MTLESRLKEIMINKYGSVKKFAEAANIPYPTLVSILQRGIKTGKFENIIKICDQLDVKIDTLKDEIVINTQKETLNKNFKKRMLAYATLFNLITDVKEGNYEIDGKELSPDEVDFVCDGIEITIAHIRMKRDKEVQKETNLK